MMSGYSLVGGKRFRRKRPGLAFYRWRLLLLLLLPLLLGEDRWGEVC